MATVFSVSVDLPSVNLLWWSAFLRGASQPCQGSASISHYGFSFSFLDKLRWRASFQGHIDHSYVFVKYLLRFFFFGPFLSWFILSYRVIAVLRVLHFGGTSPCSDICTVNIFFHCVAIFFPFCMSFLLRSRSFPFDEFQLVHIFLLSLVLCYSRPNESLVLRSHEHFLPEIL